MRKTKKISRCYCCCWRWSDAQLPFSLFLHLKKNICEKSICTLLMRNLCLYLYRSRKRRTSYTQDEREYLLDGDDMDECNAALVLMSLSCSPNSPRQGKWFKIVNQKKMFVVQFFVMFILSDTDIQSERKKNFWITEIECQYCCRLTTKKKPWTLTMTVKWHLLTQARVISIFIYFSSIYSLGKCYFRW